MQEVWSGRVLPAPEWRGGLLSCGLYRILYVSSGGGSLLCWRYFDFLFLYIMFPVCSKVRVANTCYPTRLCLRTRYPFPLLSPPPSSYNSLPGPATTTIIELFNLAGYLCFTTVITVCKASHSRAPPPLPIPQHCLPYPLIPYSHRLKLTIFISSLLCSCNLRHNGNQQKSLLLVNG